MDRMQRERSGDAGAASGRVCNDEAGPAPGAVHRAFALVAMAATLLVLAPDPASAQYFGRNKVQYDDFDFRVVETDHFRIHSYEGMSEQAVEDAARMAERWYDRLSRTFQHAFEEEVKKPLILYANQPDFQQTNAIPGFLSQATGGVTEGIKNRVIMPHAETYGETDHVLGHELVHVFQYDLAGTYQGGGSTGFQRLPLWAVEGLAEYLTVGRTSSHTGAWMRDAVLRDDVPGIRDMSDSQEYFPYRYGHALWAWIAGRFGDDTALTFYRRAARWGIPRAAQVVLGAPVDTLSRVWTEDVRSHFAPLVEDRARPAEVGQRVIPGPGEDSTTLALAPTISPNGRWVVYLGQEGLFSVDLYIADAGTGEVRGRLASASSDPHLDALAYMNTSGAWSPDGERFAFATYADGDNRIAVADVSDRSIVRRYDLAGIGAVYSIDWSPDGATMVFAGTRGGITDLFLLDVEDGAVEPLTDDRWAELHPAFSPDGSRIAFATDRPDGVTGSLQRLDFPRHGLAVLELGSGALELRRPFPGAKHIDPAWAPDGTALYFVSDPAGVSDVHRLDLTDDSVRRVTRVATGITGVTDLAPALSVARGSGEVLVSVFHDGGYMVRRLPGSSPPGEPVPVGYGEDRSAGLLPPREVQGPARVVRYLEDPSGLADPAGFRRHDYDPGLSLDYVSQPTAGVAVDRFGTSLGGSVAAFFSDMLGNRQLGVALQANGTVEDIGGQVVYARLGDRLNWNVQAGRIPYRTTAFRRGSGTVDGEEVPTAELVLDRTILNRASAGVQYPFSRTRRAEANVGATLITFDREAIRTFFSPGGVPVGRDEVELDAPSSLTLYNASAALVEDRSFFGLTSPVRGARARLEVEGNFGDLSFANVLADYRRYVFLNPLTVALRGFHLGRYGSGAESDRLTPLFVGFERYVRGYAAGSFDGADACTDVPDAPGACPELDRLVGSRMAVGNVELRIPLNGVEEYGLLDWGVVPVELSLFADAGVAWTSAESPDLTFAERSTERIPVFSSGVSARFNLLGRLVVEAYWAHPFQRPDSDGEWGFQIAPGW